MGVLYAVFYPMVSTPDMAAAMNAFPAEFQQALGFTDLTSPAGYLGATTFGILGPVLTIIFCTVLGARAVAGEEEAGRLDVLLAHPIERWQVPVERFASLVVAVLAACSLLFLVLLAIAGWADLASLGAGSFMAAALHLALLGTFFGALALCVGAATGNRPLALGVVAATGVVTYFLNTLGPAVEAIAWAQRLSPFYYYSGGRPLVNGVQVGDALVLIFAALVLVAIGAVAFERRDVAV